MSNRTDGTGPDLEAVEAGIRAAIAEAASNVLASADAAPSEVGANADAAASCANVATVWTNVTVGMIAGLERLRLAHDQVKGAGPSSPPSIPGAPGVPNEAQMRSLLTTVAEEASRGASPTRIASLLADAGFAPAEG